MALDYALPLTITSSFYTVFFFKSLVLCLIAMEQTSRAGLGAASVFICPDQIIGIGLRSGPERNLN